MKYFLQITKEVHVLRTHVKKFRKGKGYTKKGNVDRNKKQELITVKKKKKDITICYFFLNSEFTSITTNKSSTLYIVFICNKLFCEK